jgi:hypothetical protein
MHYPRSIDKRRNRQRSQVDQQGLKVQGKDPETVAIIGLLAVIVDFTAMYVTSW